MASVNWMKATTQKASGLKKHLGQTERENGNHSNEHIDRGLSYQNYAIGCSDYAQALAQMKARTKEVDEVLPPKRVRKDRVTCCFLEVPCPREITEQGKSDEFFMKVHQLYGEFFGKENIHGTFVHKDEVHEYTAKDGTTQISCEHAHTLVSAFVEGKGINGKAFETRAKIKALNVAMDEMCVREFGVHLNTGEKANRKSVETLKQESEARQELGELNKRVEEVQRFADAFDKRVDELRNQIDKLQEDKLKISQENENLGNELKTIQDNLLEYEISQKKRFLESKKAYADRIAVSKQVIAVRQRSSDLDEKEQSLIKRMSDIDLEIKRAVKDAKTEAKRMVSKRELDAIKEANEKVTKLQQENQLLKQHNELNQEENKLLKKMIEDYNEDLTGQFVDADTLIKQTLKKGQKRGQKIER